MIIKGWASVFGECDGHTDITIKGCFEKDLQRFTHTRPMLMNHEAAQVVGRWDLIEERDFGLWCEGTILDESAQFWVKNKCLLGLSIGYVLIRQTKVGGNRELHELELEEISLTSVPANRCSRIIECDSW